jgi:TM2 domain-containing membrane protein YozV
MADPITEIRYQGQSMLGVVLLGLLIPGAGHFYLGLSRRGAYHLVLAICLGCCCGLSNLLAAWDGWRLWRRLARGEVLKTHTAQGESGGMLELLGDFLDWFSD